MHWTKLGSVLRRVFLTMCAGTLAFSAGCAEQEESKKFTIINYAWTTPDTKYLHDNLADMEKQPFDGLCVFVAHPRQPNGSLLSGNNRVDLGWSVFKNEAFTPDMVKEALADLQSTPFKKFHSNYLTIVAFLDTDIVMDWSDDKWWAKITNNARMMARVARQGGCEGIMFDAEQYRGLLWTYSKFKEDPRYKDTPFEELAVKTRQRGGEYMRAINEGYPGTRMLLLFAWEWIIRATDGNLSKLPEERYGLYYYFLEGMLEAADEKTIFIDGVEEYKAVEMAEFEALAKRVREEGPKFTTSPEAFRKKVRVGFGIWMDRRGKWDPVDVENNHWTPEKFSKAITYALLASDGFVWVYNERPSFLLDSPEAKPGGGIDFDFGGATGRNELITWVPSVYGEAIEEGRKRAQEAAQAK